MVQKKTSLDYFSASFLQKQRKQLETTKKQLLKQKKRLDRFPNIGNSPDDAAQEVSEYAERVAIKDTFVDDQLKQIDAALSRIEAGTYGLDLKTGQPIEQGRLETIPEAEYAADTK